MSSGMYRRGGLRAMEALDYASPHPRSCRARALLRRCLARRQHRLHWPRTARGLESAALMKIVILGAGQVGSSVAENLVSEANDITVVDLSADRLKTLQDRFDLRTVVGNAA